MRHVRSNKSYNPVSLRVLDVSGARARCDRVIPLDTVRLSGLFSWSLLSTYGFGLVIPLLPFMAPSLGGDASDVAFIMITYAVGAAVIAPLWGRLSDRSGRRFALVLALLASSAATL